MGPGLKCGDQDKMFVAHLDNKSLQAMEDFRNVFNSSGNV
jgi:hypothetical protein